MLLFCASAFAQKADTTRYGDNEEKYNPELGYFQKAHTDLGDPRFMFTDNTGEFVFGVGATIHMTGYYDFAGAIDDYTFKPCIIPIPEDKSNHLGLTMSNTEIHLKAKSYLGRHRLIAYLQVVNSAREWSSNNIYLGRAYVSWNHFSIGRTYSFFMDLEAGAMTVDMQGPNAQIGRTHPLVGYTWPINDKWTFAIAAEEPSFNIVSTEQYGVAIDFQPVPDLAMHIKYKGEMGHVQLGGLYRNMAYYSTGINLQSHYDLTPNYKTFSKAGYGLSLSGKIDPAPWISLSAQVAGGHGISSYVNDLDDLSVNFGLLKDRDEEGYLKMDAVPVYAAYGSATINWTKSIKSSLLYGVTGIYKDENMSLMNELKSSQYMAANVFWHFSPYFFIGAEYLHGYKKIYLTQNEQEQGIIDNGHANRFDATITYRF